jgi:hypothetical protein
MIVTEETTGITTTGTITAEITMAEIITTEDTNNRVSLKRSHV